MTYMRRSILIALALLVAMLVAACGNNTNTGSGGGRYGGGSSGSTPTASAGNTITTATATINGKSETVLTNTKGLTLYYRTSDTATSVCSGGCAQAWPPLLMTGSAMPTSASTLPGTLTVSMNANGEQVEYNGHPLYTYSGDSASGQTNGEGFGGVWFVVPTDLSPSSGTPTGGGYGSGYGNNP